MSNEPGEQSAAALQTQVANLAGQVQMMAAHLQASMQRPAAEKKEAERKPWWTIAVGILGVPAAAIAIMLQFNQTNVAAVEPERVRAETEKLRAEQLKTHTEAQLLLDELAETKGKGVAAYRAEVERTLPKLQDTLTRLEKAQSQLAAPRVETVIAKFVILSLVLIGISLFFEIVGEVWMFLLNGISHSVYARNFPERAGKNAERARRRHRRLQNLMPWMHSVLGPAPHILNWGVRVAIFIAVVIPLFNEVSIALGSSATFAAVLEKATQFEIGQAISILRAAMFGSSGDSI